jgi:hypothetical protein
MKMRLSSRRFNLTNLRFSQKTILFHQLYIEREDQVNIRQTNIGFGFWLVWVLASAIGFGLGAVLGIILLLAAGVPDSYGFPILFGAMVGAAGGLAQWMIIRRQTQESGLWVPFSTIAFMMSVAVVTIWGDKVAPNLNPFFILAGIYGLLGGFLQGLILEKKGVAVGWWILASLLGGLLGSTLNGSALASLQTSATWQQMGSLAFYSIWFRLGAPFGLGLGIMTGAALVWLLRNPKIARNKATMQETG